MHEVGIAQNIIEQVKQRIEGIADFRALKITVSLGKGAGVSSEALQFGFDVAKKDSSIPYAELVIEEVPLVLSCPECKKEFESESIDSSCPSCGGWTLEVVSGKELVLTSIEYD